MDEKEFERLVREGIRDIPERFLRRLENVAVVIANEPTPAQRREMRLDPHHTLLGLYEGVPRTARGHAYSGVLPDKITIFRRPILEAAGSREEIRALVAETVWHEIAHHFGMDEAAVHRTEKRRAARRRTSEDRGAMMA